MSPVPGNTTVPGAREPSFDQVNTAARAAYPRLLEEWFPRGRLHGNEFRVGNLQGDAGQSLSVNVKSGVWKEFASDDGGSDAVSLFSAIHRLGQVEAKNTLAAALG